ncbi:hypothetical protein FUAX_01640 [Fulvitalea axinellae]|uniref:VOC domain-containing protein n=1 Tax=Fulvitalea axinellae TaxID=1182444 RepID=A0AAU9CQT9_9BACT|nr:hypothetical protein FUAX_01640 [Fulvitalea axinellae]
MKISILSIPVRDQEKAFRFYTEKLGFVKKIDMPLEDGNRWLTLVAEEDQMGPELLLEPSAKDFEPTKVYQKALYEAGIPVTQFNVKSVRDEYERLLPLGVKFSVEPTEMGTAVIAVFDDTCGNYIQIVEVI